MEYEKRRNQRSILNTKFRHPAWFQGESLTKKQALEYFACSFDFYIKPKRGKERNPSAEDYVLFGAEDGRTYRLLPEEREYFLQRKAFWTDFFKTHNWEEKNTVPEYADYLLALNTRTKTKEKEKDDAKNLG